LSQGAGWKFRRIRLAAFPAARYLALITRHPIRRGAAPPVHAALQGRPTPWLASSPTTCQGLTKAYPNGKKVLDNVHLSFYPDAKIGVLGVNGAGKSTLLRIMAGMDKEYTGDGLGGRGRARRLPAAGAATRYQPRPCARTSCSASPRRRRSSTATTTSP
jgi:hypothetical protein